MMKGPRVRRSADEAESRCDQENNQASTREKKASVRMMVPNSE